VRAIAKPSNARKGKGSRAERWQRPRARHARRSESCPQSTVHQLNKRGIMGSFHKVSKKYLHTYVAEFHFRYNNRHSADIFGMAIGGC
jgi:hypothetical protein